METDPNPLEAALARIAILEAQVAALLERVTHLEAQKGDPIDSTRADIREDTRTVTDPFAGKEDANPKLKQDYSDRVQSLQRSPELRANIKRLLNKPEIEKILNLLKDLLAESNEKCSQELEEKETPRLKRWKELNSRADTLLKTFPLFLERLRRMPDLEIDDEWLKLKGFTEEEGRLYQGMIAPPHGPPEGELSHEVAEHLTKIFYEGAAGILLSTTVRLWQEVHEAYPVETAKSSEGIAEAAKDIKPPKEFLAWVKELGFDLFYWPLYTLHVADLRGWTARSFHSVNPNEWGAPYINSSRVEEGTVMRVEEPCYKLNLNTRLESKHLDTFGGRVLTVTKF